MKNCGVHSLECIADTSKVHSKADPIFASQQDVVNVPSILQLQHGMYTLGKFSCLVDVIYWDYTGSMQQNLSRWSIFT